MPGASTARITGDTVSMTWIGLAAAHPVPGRRDRLLGLYAVMIVREDSCTDALPASALTVAVSLTGLRLQRKQPQPRARTRGQRAGVVRRTAVLSRIVWPSNSTAML
ncbi:hypothetical protein [Kitasatospora sp. NPDC001527]|uniref:hypothetical protein n=1 Tax=Kitasatospora sp. NPDC001527 TaxID=3154519 RepID=UPI00331ED4F6